METSIETKKCLHCGKNFEVTDNDILFYDRISPVFNGTKYTIPSPSLCPDCRQQRRLSFRNERNLYKRICDATGKNIISIYSPDKSVKVYEQSEWWSDKWDAKDYGMDFDFNRGFFEQFQELLQAVPQANLSVGSNNENSDYTNQTGFCKNSYLIFEGGYDEDCYYGTSVWNSTDCIDNLKIRQDSICYECTYCTNSTSLFFSQKSENCHESYFLYNCEGCKECFGCVNLTNKMYCLFNEQLSKADYENFVRSIRFDTKSIEGFKKKLEDLKLSNPNRSANIINSENVSGNDIINSKNVFYSFDISGCEDVRYSQNIYDSKSISDISIWGNNLENSYFGVSIGNNAMKIFFSVNCFADINNLFYCHSCVNGSENLFGCIGLKGEKYCILNKQYTKEEYYQLVPKIIEHMGKTGEWGEFFPASLSLFGYNETVASEYFPITRKEALDQGYHWSDIESPRPDVTKIIPASKLPEDIGNIPDDILNWAIECEITEKPFRIIKPELDFYRRHGLPVPKRHPDQRHLDRMRLKNPRTLYDRKCDKCGIDIRTTFSPDRNEIVYCEDCYEKVV